MPEAGPLVDEAPQPPAEGECCGNGCENCVWTVYQARLDAWRHSAIGRPLTRDDSEEAAHG